MAKLWATAVSIPRAGFWLFRQASSVEDVADILCFNPSGGILVVQAKKRSSISIELSSFQSLGRDSGCSGERFVYFLGGRPVFQSLGRDSGCSGWPSLACHNRKGGVSIPRAGFWLFRPPGQRPISPQGRWFQSLGRDSGCSGIRSHHYLLPGCAQFQSLGRDSGCSGGVEKKGERGVFSVSIPRAGFWLFRPPQAGQRLSDKICFNPSGGILVVQAFGCQIPIPILGSFNPSGGILVVQAGASGRAWHAII